MRKFIIYSLGHSFPRLEERTAESWTSHFERFCEGFPLFFLLQGGRNAAGTITLPLHRYNHQHQRVKYHAVGDDAPIMLCCPKSLNQYGLQQKGFSSRFHLDQKPVFTGRNGQSLVLHYRQTHYLCEQGIAQWSNTFA